MHIPAFVLRVLNALTNPARARVKLLYHERKAGNAPDSIPSDTADSLLNAALDRLGGGEANAAWWSQVAVEAQALFARPDEFRKPYVREWLAQAEVRSMLKAQVRADLAGVSQGQESYETIVRKAMDGLSENRQHAEPLVRISLAYLRASLQSAPADPAIAGLIQLSSREQHRRFNSVEQRLDAMLSNQNGGARKIGPDQLSTNSNL